MQVSDDEPAPATDRLINLGLPPRPAGWVPEQPAGLREPPPTSGGPVDAELDAEPPVRPAATSPMDSARLALASRLPDWAALRLERMTSRAFGWALCGLVGLIVVIAVGIHRHDDASLPASYDAPATDRPPSASPTDSFDDGSSIVVDVAGLVRHPGLVTLPVGARVADAIKAAGGARRHRDLVGVNLAQRVADGELLTVRPRHGRAAGGGGGSKLVSLSSASLTKLETLPGVGPVTAQKIVAWRTSHGGFTSVSQLQQVSGIGPARYAELSPLVAP